MTNPDARRNHSETIEGLCAPLQKLVAGVIALKFHLHIFLKCVFGAGEINLNGVVYDEIHRHKRLDHLGVLV